ncbi:hypothetical protein DIU31_006055 [Mucilaginibacter rubeus]|uniref:Clindamycin resistance transfer factor BtgA n=1 Tax=Mucilaginibacter rubeus TaxID=2027860 RepID=A0AAE6JCD2_9SPHI|nr:MULTISPECIES: BfmA/BtgA family mobilization protein [Mucilaginibacter]QEM03104.1 hypothetical protein DIU31_006055 [Mucilaginibacter rubeus]QEM15722.1 hypothetical protein DIU38_006125 [Mucilaginibacter gossypii]QTE41538.1 hypothetical protein J3L19_21655 [Mucilaginibacter rubeus]QTE48144.1 hypothetical protein J3L21_21655 [Mucilaginibacter rubeus]QTE59535.1 hypothetical protein J3L23_13300 [Mucilaginibacter rubeus]
MMKEQKDINIKTIRFPVALDEKIIKLSKKFGRGKLEIFGQMLEYFTKTGKDPADINDERLKSTLVKNHDTYIRFIRAQEEKILIPIKVEIDRMVASQIKIIDSFNSQVLKANKEIISGQTNQFEATEKLLMAITEKLDTKESLKLKFLYILNYYHKASLTVSSKEKETLLQETRLHVSKL